MKNKGFVLIDSLLCVIIASLLTILCLTYFKQEEVFYENYQEYQKQIQSRYYDVFKQIGKCELCQIKDTSPQEP